MNPQPLRTVLAVLVVLAFTMMALLSGCVGQRRVSEKDIKVLSMAELISLREEQARHPDDKKLLVVDSRPPAQYAEAHIPGAENIQLFDIDPDMKRDDRIDSYDTIVVYAENPGSASSPALVKRMMRMRYGGVRLFPGGLEQWIRSGMDVEAGAP